MRDVRLSSYRRTNGGAEDPNAKVLDLGPIRIWFSYYTPVAFQVPGSPRVVRENDWSNTTGRHLNEIDGRNHTDRVSGEEFERLFTEKVMRFFYPRDLDKDCPAGVVADWLQDRDLDAAAKAVRDADAAARS